MEQLDYNLLFRWFVGMGRWGQESRSRQCYAILICCHDTNALFMTVWCPDSRSVESNCGIGAEVRQTGAEDRPKGLGGSTAGGTHEGFELREAELNGIEVWTVGRQRPERGADALDRAADARDFVRGESVGDHDVPGSQRGHEDLFDRGKETRPVDGAVEDPGRGQARHPQRGEKRTGLPPGARRVVVDAGPAEGPTIPPQEIVRNAGFVEKDQACRIPGRRARPRVALVGHPRARRSARRPHP